MNDLVKPIIFDTELYFHVYVLGYKQKLKILQLKVKQKIL